MVTSQVTRLEVLGHPGPGLVELKWNLIVNEAKGRGSPERSPAARRGALLALVNLAGPSVRFRAVEHRAQPVAHPM